MSATQNPTTVGVVGTHGKIIGSSELPNGSRLRPTLVRNAVVSPPPVIILNLFYTGLGIARQFAKSRVRVIGLSSDSKIYGNFTRFCEVRRAPNSLGQPHELKDMLLDSAEELHGAIVFPTSDADLIFLERFRDTLESCYRLALPARGVLSRIINKDELMVAAMKAGVSAPKTYVLRSPAQMELAAAEVGFPCVLKPVRSLDWRQGNDWRIIGRRKALCANTLEELTQLYDRLSRVNPRVLVEELIPGDTDQLVTWGGYVGREGSRLTYFTARKLIQSPDEFGTGCLVSNDNVPDLLEPSLRLCQELNYEGIAEIEYKRDCRDGALKLIEMNPRHWDWHELGSASGANLSLSAYRYLSGIQIPGGKPARQRATWIAEDAFTRQVVSNLLEGKRILPTLRRVIRGKHIYGMFRWNDPLPLLRYSLSVLAPEIIRSVSAKSGFKRFRLRPAGGL